MGDERVITLELTEEQRAAVRRLTGRDAAALELSAKELEGKLAYAETLASNRRAPID